jgi:rhodanese-related sulfurtransferase
MGLTLKYSLETHVHADHITAGGLLRQRLGTQTAVNELCGAESADIQIQDGDVFEIGSNEQIKVISTPGHTPGSSSFLWRDRVFTGDSLLIGGCGRTDFQGGDAGGQYDSITLRLFTLPDETLVYPGHDYNGNWISCIIQEKMQNPRLAGKTRDEFIDIMLTLNLPKPKLIDEAVPANRYCGVDEDQRQDEMAQGNSSVTSARDYPNSADIIRVAKQQITEISVSAAREQIEQNNICLVDVRETQEYQAGHIDNAISLPRGLIEFKLGNLPELQDKAAPILLYCGSGNRSALAAVTLEQLGYQRIMSLAGGFKAWNEHQPA